MRAYRKLIFAVFVACLVPAFGAVDHADSYYHFSLGKMYQLRESYPAALKEFRAALDLDPDSSGVRIAMAETMLQMGDFSKAVDVLQEAVRIDPDSVDAHLMLGRIFSSVHSADRTQSKALAEFEKVLEIDPENLEALQGAAELRDAAGDYEKALADFERLRKLVPSNLGAYYSESAVLISLNRYDDAIRLLKEGLQIRDDIPDYMRRLGDLLAYRGRFDEAIDIYKRGLGTDPKNQDSRLIVGLARTYLHQGRGSEAVPLLQRLNSTDPQDEEVRYDLARAYLEVDRLEDAREILEGLEKESNLTTSPSRVEVGISLANAFAGLGELDQAADKLEALLQTVDKNDQDVRLTLLKNLALLRERQSRNAEAYRAEAIQLLEQVVKADPGDLTSQLQLVDMYSRASRHEDALALSQSLLDEHPEDAYVLIARARALASAGQIGEGVGLLQEQAKDSSDAELLYLAASQIYLSREQFKGAQQVVEQGLVTLPSSEELRFQLGAIYERQSDYGAAENEFKQVIDARPDYAEALNYLGYMLAERGARLGEALGYVKRAVELQPHNGAFLDSLGWVYFKQDDLDKAEVHLREAARLESRDPTILEHLGDLYVRKGDIKSARHFYKDSIRFAEKDEDSRRIQKKLDRLAQPTPGS
jgi:tetratricopeptide (TPR) repeat protein